jgi:ABC-type multidrug transport system fused ATPase/permease subunit
VQRISAVFDAELLQEVAAAEHDLPAALEVTDTRFSWDSPLKEAKEAKERRRWARAGDKLVSALRSKKNKGAKAAGAGTPSAVSPGTRDAPEEREERVFSLHGINMSIPRGQLVAIVGPVGSGKTSLLQGLLGEMRRASGTVRVGGSISYCPQSAWIQNATVRENVCFGRPFEEGRYWRAVRDSCLEPDLEMLPFGDLTEVGEKGISLSGGQKQRLNICRAIYCNTDIQIFVHLLSSLSAFDRC